MRESRVMLSQMTFKTRWQEKNIFKDEFFQKPIEVLLSLTDNAVNFMKQLDILVSSYESMIEKLEVDVAIVEKERVRIVELLEEYVRDVHESLAR